MDESRREPPPADAWRQTLAQTIEQQRHRIGERIAGQRERLRELEARIASQVDAASQQLAQEQDRTTQRAQDTQRQRRHIAQQVRAERKKLAAEAEAQRAQVAATGSAHDAQLQVRLAELQNKYDRLRVELTARDLKRDESTQRLAELRTQLETRQQELRHQQSALEQAQKKQTELEADRGRLQGELQRHLEEGRKQAEAARIDLARHASQAQLQAAEITRLTNDLERVRREGQEQIERMRADQGKSHDAQVQSLHEQLDGLRKKSSDDEASWQRIRKDLEGQLVTARQSAASPEDAEELAKWRDEKKQLEQRLQEAEKRAKEGGSGGGQEMDDLRRRFEMAVQDVRELKTKNSDLTEQLAKARQAGGGAAAAGGAHGGDWESLKKKLLAELETDFDEGNEGQKADKLTVQGAIKITDQVVSEKEQEIQELRRLLENQSQQVGDVAVGAAAVAEMLDSDELIRQERESLKRLQDSLREQLRQAEVDISVERAKLARERAELDEKHRSLETEKANLPAGGDASDKGKKGGGRKWLTRLGLGDGKDG